MRFVARYGREAGENGMKTVWETVIQGSKLLTRGAHFKVRPARQQPTGQRKTAWAKCVANESI